MNTPDSEVMAEIGAALADLVEAVGRRDDRSAKAMSAAAAEIGTPLADLLAAVEKIGPEMAKAVIAAIQKFPPPAAAPALTLTPEVRVEMPAPVVNIPEINVEIQGAKRWRFFDVEYHPNGSFRGMSAERVE